METIKGFIQMQPDMMFTASGIPITRFPIADIEAEEDYDKFKKIICWEELAEAVNNCLVAGQQVYVKGYWKTREWQGSDGKQHTTSEFTARQVWSVEENGTFLDLMESYKER